MKYKKIFRWEIFAGILLILVTTFILLNLLVDTVFKNVLDKELSNRLEVIGGVLEKRIEPIVFSLTPEDKFTGFYARNMAYLNEVRETWGMDLAVITADGRTCMTTSENFSYFTSYILGMLGNLSNFDITVFDSKTGPVKTYFHPYRENGKVKGYIVMRLAGDKALPFFGEINRMKAWIIAVLFVFAILISFIFSYFITRRIEYTAKKIEEISRGKNTSIRVTWFDELSYLQEQINNMVIKLKEMEENRAREIQIVAMGLAHEIKNPAGAILNLAELIEKGRAGEKTPERLAKIKSEVLRLNNITDKFIQFAREEQVQKEKVTFDSLVEMIKEQYSGVKAQFDGVSGKSWMEMDPVLMERALKNIIKNAYEAGAKNVSLNVIRNEKFGAIKICDDAPLIPDEIRDRIFVSFFSTKSAGMGIGLAITRSIIEKHGGRIEYRAENSKNCFEITVPAEEIIIEQE